MVDLSNEAKHLLAGRYGIVTGIANSDSIAYGCAKAFRALGADIAVTYLNEKARPHVQPLAESLGADLFLPLDVTDEQQMQSLFDQVREKWGRLDFMLHSIAFAPKEDLQGRLLDCSLNGFMVAMDVSCHSFIRLARLAEPLMTEGGTLFTMTYIGSERVVPNYNVMGPVKAAIEACVRYLAYELGPKGIRVHAISPGPLKTRAASGLKGFDQLMAVAMQRAPAHDLVDIDDVGMTTAYLASPFARLMTGNTIYIDGGYHVMG